MKSRTEESSEMPMIQCEEVVKFYMADGLKVMALQGLDLTVNKGEMMAVIGKSGSGKSTLMNMIGCLETPTMGKIYINGVELSGAKSKELEIFRKKTIGFVWQNSLRNLFPYMSVLENVMAPMICTGMSSADKKKRALELLEEVGIPELAGKMPLKLSGGQQQRVAIAVALANNPEILLADEPTGAVDSKTSAQILELFKKLNREKGITILIVTHDMHLASCVDRVVEISDGKISSETLRQTTGFSDADENDGEQFAVLDRAGRVKLSDDILTEAGISGNKVKVSVEDGDIIIKKVT